MGYTTSNIKHLNKNPQWVKGRDVLTLGTLYPFVSDLSELGDACLSKIVREHKEDFSHAFLKEHLSAQSVSALDVDDYQNAELILNLNSPIQNDNKCKYDTVIDFGTLEHLSNFSTAIKNIFDLLKIGGYYCFSIPTNNFLDHGFFQISPTFFIDLCKANPSLRIKELYFSTNSDLVHWHEMNKYTRRVFMKTRQRVMVGGVIEKVGSELNLDLIQSKYEDAYSIKGKYQADLDCIQNKEPMSFESRLRGILSMIPGLSTKFRLLILNKL